MNLQFCIVIFSFKIDATRYKNTIYCDSKRITKKRRKKTFKQNQEKQIYNTKETNCSDVTRFLVHINVAFLKQTNQIVK